MAGITQPKPGEHVNANGVWDLLQNKGKMTVFSLCLLLCADLLDLAVGKSDPPPSPSISSTSFFLFILHAVGTAHARIDACVCMCVCVGGGGDVQQ